MFTPFPIFPMSKPELYQSFVGMSPLRVESSRFRESDGFPTFPHVRKEIMYVICPAWCKNKFPYLHDEDIKYEQKILNDIENIDSETWWEMLDEFLTEYIDNNSLDEDKYFGHIFVALIYDECIEDENFDNVRMKNSVSMDKINTLETWIGIEEVKALEDEINEMSDEKKKETVIIYLYSNSLKFITSFQTDKDTIDSWN